MVLKPKALNTHIITYLTYLTHFSYRVTQFCSKSHVFGFGTYPLFRRVILLSSRKIIFVIFLHEQKNIEIILILQNTLIIFLVNEAKMGIFFYKILIMFGNGMKFR
jgi:hypothetical protein